MSVSELRWDNISGPAVSWLDFNFRELFSYRDLFKQYIYRNFVANYKQSILGPLWFLIKPALTTIVFTVVFGRIAKISTGAVPTAVFYMASTIIWSFFSTCLSSAANTFNANSNVFGKVYFPRLIIPLAEMVSPLIPFGAHFLVFFGLYGFYVFQGQVDVSGLALLFLLPLVLLQAIITALGMGLLFASLTTKYKDLLFLIDFITQLWMYVTPVVYPIAQIPDGFKWVCLLNPMTGVMELSRKIFFNVFEMSLSGYFLNFGLALLFCLVGLIFFNKIEKTFIDTL
ncbi:MAG: ABC transporter permease [Candidatus Margulisbacteria bacterium]|jgi:lipopolysaccharide transport system permease protein|nr:ABC transporter permease [Candidatus Margulisiibacteriota bacterium]